MTRVVVVGDLMTDTVAHAALPLAKGSDTPATVTMHGGGSGANIAAWLAMVPRWPSLGGVVPTSPGATGTWN
jgi:sugar/nucleoside kinase (ribokinase family)